MKILCFFIGIIFLVGTYDEFVGSHCWYAGAIHSGCLSPAALAAALDSLRSYPLRVGFIQARARAGGISAASIRLTDLHRCLWLVTMSGPLGAWCVTSHELFSSRALAFNFLMEKILMKLLEIENFKASLGAPVAASCS